MSSNEFNILRIQALEKRVKELEEELKLQDQKRESLEWHYKLESDELKAELKQDNIELKNANKLAHERIKKLEEFDQNLNKAGYYRFTKDLEDTIVHLKARIKELERNIEQLEMELQ